MNEFDEAEAEKQEGMRRVHRANPEFTKGMVEAIRQLATEQLEFPALSAWLYYKGTPPTDVRAMGPAIAIAKRQGIIEASGKWTNSRRKTDHNDHVPIWRSKIYKSGTVD